jgi:hypothetical protein
MRPSATTCHLLESTLHQPTNDLRACWQIGAHFTLAHASVSCQLSTFQSANDGEPGFLEVAMTEWVHPRSSPSQTSSDHRKIQFAGHGDDELGALHFKSESRAAYDFLNLASARLPPSRNTMPEEARGHPASRRIASGSTSGESWVSYPDLGDPARCCFAA